MHVGTWRPTLIATSLGLTGVLLVSFAIGSNADGLVSIDRKSTAPESTDSKSPAPKSPAPKSPAPKSPAPKSTAPKSTDSERTTTTSRWLQPVTEITPVKGCNRLTAGMNGVKVKIVQRKLGFSASKWETMDASTRAAVRRFQRGAGLPVNGVVNNRTWKAMGFTAAFCSYDRWQAKVTVREDATSAQRISHMIKYARTFLGREYVWGGTGAYGQGVDCSGLVLQALYSSGLDPQPITVLKHPLPDYRTSLELYNHNKLRHVARRNARRGDLVFWRNNTTRRVNHVGIYLGSGRTLEASGDNVHIGRLNNRSTQTMMPQVVRPFA